MKGILTRVSNFLTRIKSISRMTDDSIRPDLRTGSVSGGGSPVLEKDERSSPVSATEAAQALFERLERSVMNHDPEIRRLKSEDLRDQNVLVNQLISLMFRVREANTTLITANWLNDALDEASEVDLHLSVFYIYLDENTPIGQWDEIKRAIFRQLNDYVKLHEWSASSLISASSFCGKDYIREVRRRSIRITPNIPQSCSISFHVMSPSTTRSSLSRGAMMFSSWAVGHCMISMKSTGLKDREKVIMS